MIVDTSALMAIVSDEPEANTLSEAIALTQGLVPAPALIEFHRVVSRTPNLPTDKAISALAQLRLLGLGTMPFTAEHAEEARLANLRFGIGVARGGTLNLLDLMVYACARVEGRPILCTGRDFPATDALIHPASRLTD